MSSGSLHQPRLDLILGGTVVIDDTTVTGNHASTNDNNVSGTFTT